MTSYNRHCLSRVWVGFFLVQGLSQRSTYWPRRLSLFIAAISAVSDWGISYARTYVDAMTGFNRINKCSIVLVSLCIDITRTTCSCMPISAVRAERRRRQKHKNKTIGWRHAFLFTGNTRAKNGHKGKARRQDSKTTTRHSWPFANCDITWVCVCVYHGLRGWSG